MRRFFIFALLIAAAIGVAPQRPTAAADETPASRSARVVYLLESGRVPEALAAARKGVAEFPASGLLRRRLAQAHLCDALRLDRGLDTAADDALWARGLAQVLASLRQMDPVPGGDSPRADEERERNRAAAEKLLAPDNVQRIRAFQQQARKQLAGTGPVLEQRSRALQDAFSALKEARRLGDDGTERELTQLWARATALLSRKERDRFTAPATRPADGGEPGAAIENPLGDAAPLFEKVLAPFSDVIPEALLKEAATLAKDHLADPIALAGAADLITLSATLAQQREPWAFGRAGLDRSWPLTGRLPANDPYRDRARAAYRKALDARELDLLAEPWTAALQLYLRAGAQDQRHSLPYLQARVYFLHLPFEPEEARRILTDIQRQEPRNGVVALEQARAAFLAADDGVAGVARLRDAARMPEFRRSFFVAIPEPIRGALSVQRGLREIPHHGWPGYLGTFSTIEGLERTADGPARVDLKWLRLQLGERLSGAPDYVDRREGLRAAHSALGELLAAADQLPPAERQRLAQAQARIARAGEGFPQPRGELLLTTKGIRSSSGFESATAGFRYRGPAMWMISADTWIFSADMGISGR